jgi:hypothetical protein
MLNVENVFNNRFHLSLSHIHPSIHLSMYPSLYPSLYRFDVDFFSVLLWHDQTIKWLHTLTWDE